MPTITRAVLAIFAVQLLAEAQGLRFQRPFERHPFYDALAAEPRSAQTKVMFPGLSSSFPGAVNPGRGLVWDISVGDEIPVLVASNSASLQEGDAVGPKRFGFGIYFPLSFHMIEDMGKDESNPILNTDYRFGAMLKMQLGLASKIGAMRDTHLGIRYVPIAHESTHIGDEFTLHAVQKYGPSFRRVNVSYQYWEIGGSFDPNFLRDARLQLKIRGGVIKEAFNGGKGWYSSDLIQPVGGAVTPSKRNVEPYLGLEAYLAPQSGQGFGPVISVDVRDRTVYGYDRLSPSIAEATQWSWNALIGARQTLPNAHIQPSYFFRYYHGVNPAGQFRDQQNYQLLGLEVQFRF